MYHPRTDVTHRYRYVPADFIKHLATTTLVVAVLAVVMAAVFREPVRPALKIQQVANQQPILFQEVALGDLSGQGKIASYGPPYNHGTNFVQTPMQVWVGVIHPIDPRNDFVLKPLAMARVLNPQIGPALTQWQQASSAQQSRWMAAYGSALHHARAVNGHVIVPTGHYGPVPTMLNGLLQLGQSGLMTGALNRSPADYQFDNMPSLLFLQGKPLHQAASKLELLGEQWGIIHEENAPYPGPWWMTIVTAIYQIPYIANASAADAMALTGGMVLFLLLVLAPWLPVINRLPRYLGVHRLIWRDYYRTQHPPSDHPASPEGSS